MSRVSRIVFVSAVVIASTAFAQEDEDVTVAVPGAAGRVQVQGDDVRMDLAVPGAQMTVQGTQGQPQVRGDAKGQVRVQQRTTVTTTTSTVTTGTRAGAVVVQQPAPVVVAYRDCGTGQDPGCVMARDGVLPMDGPTFLGLLQALEATQNELSRQEMCESLFGAHFATAAQLGRILKLFHNEITRLEVAKTAAPRVVNPSHALGLASLWQNSISAQEYTQLMASQRP